MIAKPGIVLYLHEKQAAMELLDYKLYCMNGVVDSIMVCVGRATGSTKFCYFDREWRYLDYVFPEKRVNGGENTIEKPKNLTEMIQIAERLSENIPFVRVDLYSVSGRTYFGEMTFFPSSGWDQDNYPVVDKLFGDKLKIKK